MAINININTTFTGNTDTPSSYSGQGGKVPVVKNDETGLDFDNPCCETLYTEHVIYAPNMKNFLHKGISLISNSDPNKYIDVKKIAFEYSVDTPFIERLSDEILVFEDSEQLSFAITDLEYIDSPFTIEWVTQVIDIVNLQGFSDDLYTITFSGGSGTLATMQFSITGGKCGSIHIEDTGMDYQIGDVLEIPPLSPFGNTNAIVLPAITEFPLSPSMSANQLFWNGNVSRTIQSPDDIFFSMIPMTGLGLARAAGNEFGHPITKDDRGKSLYFFRQTLFSGGTGIAGKLLGGGSTELRLKIWYELRTVGPE